MVVDSSEYWIFVGEVFETLLITFANVHFGYLLELDNIQKVQKLNKKVRKKMIMICVIECIYFSPARWINRTKIHIPKWKEHSYCIKRKFSKGITKACGLLDLPKINYHRTETCLLKNVNHIILILSFREHALHFSLSFAI